MHSQGVIASRFEDLEVWKLGRELRQEVSRLTSTTVLGREFALRDQLLASARSICANVAEGFGRRSHPDFARFLDLSMGSLNEVRNHLLEALDRGLVTKADIEQAESLVRRNAAAHRRFAAYLRSTPTPDFRKHNR